MSLTVTSAAQSGNGMGSLFSSLSVGSPSQQDAGGSIYSLLGQYSSIQNGAYSKLVSKYFGPEGDGASAAKDIFSARKDMTTRDFKSNKAYTALNDANSLESSIKALSDKSLYEKKEVKKDDGTTASEYDMDTLYKKVKSYVDDYNDLIESGSASSSSGIRSNVNSIVSRTSGEKDALEKAGITIKSDNTLAIDADKFKKSDIDDLKALFGNTGGYASMTGINVDSVQYYAQSAASSGSLYSSSGTFEYGTFGSSFSVSS